MTITEGNAASYQAEPDIEHQVKPDIDLNAFRNELPIAQATMVDPKASSVPAAGGSPPYVGVVPAQGAPPTNVGFLGRAPQMMRCPHCAVEAFTHPRSQIDAFTVIAAVILLFFFWPIFWIPFVIPDTLSIKVENCVDWRSTEAGCQSTAHKCGNCRRTIGLVGPFQ